MSESPRVEPGVTEQRFVSHKGKLTPRIAEVVGHTLTARDWNCVQVGMEAQRAIYLECLKYMLRREDDISESDHARAGLLEYLIDEMESADD